ncbi:unnamed protein product [Ectocarpus sp. 12 AP-2014]
MMGQLLLIATLTSTALHGLESRLLLQLQRFHGTLCLTLLGETASFPPTNSTADGGNRPKVTLGRTRRNVDELILMSEYRERWQLLRGTSRSRARGQNQHRRASRKPTHRAR